MQIYKITKYDEINIIPNSLIVLDIDETLIKFENINQMWWNTKFNELYKKTKNYDYVEKMIYNEWLNIINNSTPSLVDNCVHEFISNSKKNNCKIILLTARNDSLFNLTLNHLEKVDLNFSHIYFNENKGDELKKILSEEFIQYTNIIVVDDLISNLNDIKEKNNVVNLHLYNMKM